MYSHCKPCNAGSKTNTGNMKSRSFCRLSSKPKMEKEGPQKKKRKLHNIQACSRHHSSSTSKSSGSHKSAHIMLAMPRWGQSSSIWRLSTGVATAVWLLIDLQLPTAKKTAEERKAESSAASSAVPSSSCTPDSRLLALSSALGYGWMQEENGELFPYRKHMQIKLSRVTTITLGNLNLISHSNSRCNLYSCPFGPRCNLHS